MGARCGRRAGITPETLLAVIGKGAGKGQRPPLRRVEVWLVDAHQDSNSHSNNSNSSDNEMLEQQLETLERSWKHAGATSAENSGTLAKIARRLIAGKPDRRDQRECWLVRTRMAFPSLVADSVLRARSAADYVSSPRSQLQPRVDLLHWLIAMSTSMTR